MFCIKQLSLVAATALLIACGGGGGDGGSTVTTISNDDATDAVSLAKQTNILASVNSELLTLGGVALKEFTVNGLYTGAAGSVAVAQNCRLSGNVSARYGKNVFGTGLAAGDWVTITFNACQQEAGVFQYGALTAVASTATSLDISNSTTFSFPHSTTYTNFSTLNGSESFTYNGQVVYTKFNETSTSLDYSLTSNKLSLRTIVTFNNVAEDITFNYNNLLFNLNGGSTLNTSGIYDLVVTSPSESTALTMTINAQTTGTAFSTPTFMQPRTANYTITNYLGGKIIGSYNALADIYLTASIDDTSDNVIDRVFKILFTTL